MNPDQFTQWLDGRLDKSLTTKFDNDPEALAERDAWLQVQATLRKELTPTRLPHPDFINARVLEAIERERKASAQAGGFSIRRLAFGGVFSVATAALLAVILLPGAYQRPDEAEFISQVISARAGNPKATVSSFEVPDERGVVLWMDETPFIPSEEQVR
jgi:hypothetical protein